MGLMDLRMVLIGQSRTLASPYLSSAPLRIPVPKGLNGACEGGLVHLERPSEAGEAANVVGATLSPEAHDALHHFSCKMLTPRHCTGNCSFKPPLLP